MPVGNLGPREVVTIGQDAPLRELTETLDSAGVGSAVVTEDGAPIGIVTDRDAALAIHAHDDVASAPVEAVMTADPATISEDAEVIEIARRIDEHNVRRFPVVDDSGDLTGIVTLDDLVSTIGEQLDDVADTIEAQSPEYSP
ncbi:CBS domain-containing protein [Natronoarchaeum philippinense]|uniref:CBS domain-containing protein n=1 Tax=Natronoarchaeum philippinense TaxID=558529 RepID=A0A285P491_NATPI|nr:CBS domain-containing protein [Natronoarchaeum philippinense]SNZ16278.1 CBS domain-containing protein [Natronoarchaeum philippinense]